MSDLSQIDLSHLSLREMTADQKAEIKRRLETFVRSLDKAEVRVPVEKTKKPAKWVPGMKRRG